MITIIVSIDRDGAIKGYDLALVNEIRESIRLPIRVLGSAGSLRDISALIHSFGIIRVAAGSLFVFKGIYRDVLINYPNRLERDELVAHACEAA